MARHEWAGLQRERIALDRIMARALCVVDDEQIAGYGRVRGVIVAADMRRWCDVRDCALCDLARDTAPAGRPSQ